MQITGLILVANLIDQPQEVDKINYGVSIHFEMLRENNDTKTMYHLQSVLNLDVNQSIDT